MIPLLLAASMAFLGYAIGRQTKATNKIVSGSGFVMNPAGHWERVQAQPSRDGQGVVSAVTILIKLVAQRLPVSPGLAQAAYAEAMQTGDVTTAQQIALVFFQRPVPPPQPQWQVSGEDESAALQETYGDMEAAKATSTTVHHGPQPQSASVQDISPQEWREFLLCFKTKEPSYKGERHYGAFDHSTRRLQQLGLDPSGLTTEDAQLSALDKDLNNYLQSSERLLNDFTGESVNVNGEKVSVTRSGVLALLKASGPAGAKGWLTEENQRKAFPHTTEVFKRGNGRF